MIVDVLKRYLLLVWNFFFGQVSSESIQDAPSSPASSNEERPAPAADSIPPSAEERQRSSDDESDGDEDGAEEDEVEEDEVEEDEAEEDDEEILQPKKPERKHVGINSVPAAAEPDDGRKTTADVKAPEVEVRESKGEPKEPESPTTTTASDPKEPVKPRAEEKTPAEPKPPVSSEAAESKRDAPKKTGDAPEKKEDAPESSKGDAPEKKGDAPEAPKPAAGEVADGAKGTADGAKGHVKFEDPNDRFVSSEKGDSAVPQRHVAGGITTPRDVDAFLSGEQRHAAANPQDAPPHRPETIQDQTLEYSDSGEELSDDDIEIDYEDDDEDDEDVEEVKPLPPVARTVYKKND